MTAALPESDATTRALRDDLARLVTQGHASDTTPDRVAYAKDLWPRHLIEARRGVPAPAPPAVIVWPSTVDEVVAVVRYAAARGVPLVPFGAGSGVCGGVRPSRDAIVLDVKRMRAVRAIDEARLMVDAEAGIIGQALEDRLAERAMTLGHFPSSIACSTLGGWLAARSAGQCSGRYGKIEDMVQSLTCVDGNGEVHRPARGGDASDLLPLVVGSEGILAVITDARLRIAPAPTERQFAAWTFPSTAAGLLAIREIFQAGLRPAVTRLYDPFDSAVARRNRAAKDARRGVADDADAPGIPGGARAFLLRAALGAPRVLNALVHGLPDALLGGAMLVLLWEDDPRIGDAERRAAARIAELHDGRDLGEAPARRWLAHRHAVSYRQSPMLAMGAFIDTMEVASPWSRLLPMYTAVHAALSQHVFVMAHFSHAYPDGASIYFTFAGTARDDERALVAYDAAWRDALVAVVAAGGTLSHHHGVGRSKAPAMRSEQGAAIEVVRALKDVMDPRGILNPGALLPQGPPAAPPPVAPPSRAVVLDRDSLVAEVPGGTTLSALEDRLAGDGLTLGLREDALRVDGRTTVAAWLAAGAPGARDPAEDPVAQLVTGLDLELPNGTTVSIRPAPRRAVGPDLLAATVGGGERLGRVLAAHLVVRPVREAESVAWTFRSRAAAEEARAWVRGRGVRAAGTELVEVGVATELRVHLEGDPGRRAAARAVVAEIATARGGTPLTNDSGETVRTGAHDARRHASSVLDALAASLHTKETRP